MKTTVAAIDLGATSGRVIVGEYSREGLELTEVHRFFNTFHELSGNSYWDIGALADAVREGIRKARNLFPHLQSVGVNTWGVDHAIVDADGRLVFPVHAYRDTRTNPVLERIRAAGDHHRLYAWTGIPPINYNTGVQLKETLDRYPALRQTGTRVLLLSDYFNFLLSGTMANEFSQSSTGQIVDASSQCYSREALEYFGIPQDWLQGPEMAGRRLGKLRDIAGCEDLDVILVPGHDTSCAFEVIPASAGSLIISSGTWLLAGAMTNGPLLGEEALELGISNERTGNGGYRPCKILIGLWLLEQTIPAFDKRPSTEEEWSALISAAEDRPEPPVLIDTNASELFSPKNMKAALDAQLAARGGTPPRDLPGYLRLICSSLGQTVADTTARFARLADQSFDNIVIVGGGAKNRLLCQSIADKAGIPVTSYRIEASSMGNMAYQLLTLGAIDSLETLRQQIRPKLSEVRYDPR